jgi:hypothetical protein
MESLFSPRRMQVPERRKGKSATGEREERGKKLREGVERIIRYD